jgi:hypothetical protein
MGSKQVRLVAATGGRSKRRVVRGKRKGTNDGRNALFGIGNGAERKVIIL